MAKPVAKNKPSMTRAEVDEFINARLAEQRAAKVAPQPRTYPMGIAAVGAVHPGFKNLYDALTNKPLPTKKGTR